MKRIIVGLIAMVMLLTASPLHAVRYGIKKSLPLGTTGASPAYLAYSPVSNTMYCGNTGTAAGVRYIDCAQDSLLGVVPPGGFMIGPMAYDAVNNRIHMKGMDQYTAIDCATNTVDTTFMGFQGGLNVAYNGTNNKVYLPNELFYEMQVYSAVTYSFITAFPGWNGFTLHFPPTNSVYIPNNNSLGNKDSLGVFSGATDSMTAMISIPGLGSSTGKRMAANPALNRLYVALDNLDRVAVINTATNTLLSSPAVGDNPADFALDPVTGRMFVACNGTGQYSLRYLNILDTVDSVRTGDSVGTVVYNPKDSLIYIGCRTSGYVKIVDPRLPQPLVIDSVYVQYNANFTDMEVDAGGDVYAVALNSDNVSVIGQIPLRMWRSATSGTWSAYPNWQYSDNGGTTWQFPMMMETPNCATDSLVTVQAGHTMSISSVVVLDQVQVDGELYLVTGAGCDVTILDGPGDDVVVNGIFRQQGGLLTVDSGAVLRFAPSASYVHEVNGGSIPPATWDPSSTLRVTGVQDLTPAGLDQAFGDIVWYCLDQYVDAVLPGGAAFSSRDITVSYTGTGRLFLTSPTVPALTIGGGLTIEGSPTMAVLGGGGTRSVTVNGNLTVYDPAWLHLTDSASHGISTLNLRGNYLHGVSGIAGGGPDSTTIVFCGADTQQYDGSLENLTGYVNYRVDPGSFLMIGNGRTVGSNSLGWFTLMPGATLGMSDMSGLYPAGQDFGPVRVLGARNYSQDANYYYYSFSTGLYPTGPGLPDTVHQLIINSPGDAVVLSKSLAVKDTLKLLYGPLRIGSQKLSLYGQIYSTGGSLGGDSTSRLAVLGIDPLPLFISASVSGLDTLELNRPAGADLGGPLPIRGAYIQTGGKIHTNWLQYGPAARLVYSKPDADTTTAGEFPISDGPRNVTVNTGGPLYLHDDRIIPGALSLSQGALTTGAYTLTVDSLGTVSRSAGYVEGNLRRYVRQIDTMAVYDLGTTAAGYTPVRLRPFNTGATGFITAGVTGTPYPGVSNASACLRKYWSFSSPGMTADSCRLTVNYSPDDFNLPNFTESAHEALMAAGRYDNGATPGWGVPVVVARNPGGINDGGSIVLSQAGLFAANPDYTLGRDTVALWAGPDSTAPTAPQNLLANGSSPSPWYSGGNNLAAVAWDNPSDPSGIAKAYYKTYAPPASNGNATDSFSINIGGPSDTLLIPVDTLNGTMPVHVWLGDSAGNADYRNYATINLRRDIAPPTGVQVRPFASDTISNSNVDIYWSRGSDALSGMQAYRLMFQTDTTGAPWDTMVALSPDTAYYIESLTAGHWYRFEAAGCDSAGNWETLTGVPERQVFVRAAGDSIPPLVAIIAPDTGAVWQNQTLQSIIWNESDNIGLVRRELYYRVNPVSPWVVIDTLYGAGTNPDTFSWFVPYVLSAQTQVKVVAYDGAGNRGADSSWLFTITDTIRPSAVSLTPVSGDTAVGVMMPVVIGFSEPVQDTSLRFTCLPSVGGWQPLWNTAHDSVSLTHPQFSAGRSYAFTVTAARDRNGNPLAGTLQTVFTTVREQTYSTPWQGGAYRLFSVPAEPVETTAVGMLQGSLGAYSDTTWRVFWFNTATTGFVERPRINNGQAYWLASRASAGLHITGTPNTQVMTRLKLEPGWNLIGDPYNIPLAVATVEISDDSGNVYGYNDPGNHVNDSLVRQRLWTYNDNSFDLLNNGVWDTVSAFDTAGTLDPWNGYAVYAVARCNLDLYRMKKGAPSPKGPPPSATITWELGIEAESGAGADRGVRMGISEQAKAGYDRLDAEKPPLVTSEITAEIPHPEWMQGPCSGYQYDYRPAAGYLEWPLSVRQRDPRRQGVLRLRESGRLAAGQRAYLVDRKLGTALEIAGTATVSFTGSREFAVVCSDRTMGSLKLKPLAFGMDRLYPNPFGGTATVSYQVPKAGRVSLKVYNVAGQLVRTLVDGVQEAGYYGVSWNGASQGRQAAASGLYLVRLAYGNETRTEKLVKIR